MDERIWKLHDRANREGRDFYVDPSTGYRVFTEQALRRRGRCCGSGCRHCPFAHRDVPVDRRAALAQVPAWLTAPPDHDDPVHVLFWSGGKDSLLAWRALRRADVRHIVLLTTFDAPQRRVAQQEVSLEDIVRQAVALEAPLIGVPLHPGCDYLRRVADGLRLLPRVARLVFGDLHLDHLRRWRETAFAPLLEELGAELAFPLWQVEYAVLLTDLDASGIPCVVSASDPTRVPDLKVGTRFGAQMLADLPPDVDAFGEAGEFHTLARVWEAIRP